MNNVNLRDKVIRENREVMGDIKLPDKEFFRVDEVARLFGISRSTIYRWIEEGILVPTKIGINTTRIHRDSLKVMIKSKNY